jgi:hypothetical protein
MSFRCSRVDIDRQCLEYTLIVQHREAWQNYSVVQLSKCEIVMFGLNLTKALKMAPSIRSVSTNQHLLDDGMVTPSKSGRRGIVDY